MLHLVVRASERGGRRGRGREIDCDDSIDLEHDCGPIRLPFRADLDPARVIVTYLEKDWRG